MPRWPGWRADARAAVPIGGETDADGERTQWHIFLLLTWSWTTCTSPVVLLSYSNADGAAQVFNSFSVEVSPGQFTFTAPFSIFIFKKRVCPRSYLLHLCVAWELMKQWWVSESVTAPDCFSAECILDALPVISGSASISVSGLSEEAYFRPWVLFWQLMTSSQMR